MILFHKYCSGNILITQHVVTVIKMSKKYAALYCLLLFCVGLSGCAGVNGSASGNNSGVRASTDIFKW